VAGLKQLNWASEGVGATAAALVDLSTVAGNKISNPPWVKFQSAGWVNFPSAPTISTLEDALALANEPEYSLHAGIFTSNLNIAMKAAKLLEAGGVMINDSSDYRFDAMPFGGFKYGSMGREGVRFAYEDMTQPKVICLNGPSE